MGKAEAHLIPAERIESRISLLRGQKVLLDHDLAALYEIPTKALKRAVKRNAVRFPDDFMFVLDEDELADLRCQFGTSSSWGGLRYPPMAFTERKYDSQFSVVFDALRELMNPPDPPRKPIGFRVQERRSTYRAAAARH
jgi:hypothetical protein